MFMMSMKTVTMQNATMTTEPHTRACYVPHRRDPTRLERRRHMKTSMGCLALCWLSTYVIACGGHGEPNHHAGQEHSHQVSTRATQVAMLQGDARTGAVLYASDCKGCHGEDGRGGAHDFDLVQSVNVHGDDELAQSILAGSEDMPPYDNAYDNQQIADVLAHLHTF